MSQISGLQRAEVYKDHRVQLLLSKFISGEIGRVDPTFDCKHGYRYPVVETIVGDPADVEAFLRQLSQQLVLEKELHDVILHCPSCGSAVVSVRYRCPYCRSFDVKKSSLIEHVSCGYIDTEEGFLVTDTLVCPKCSIDLTKKDKDYRKAGIWCTCNECDKSFDIPTISHFCRDCHKDFLFEDAICNKVYSYTLSANAVDEASLEWVFAEPIKTLLQAHGYKVESPGHLKGASGANHMFDIAASCETTPRTRMPKNLIVFDISTSTDNAVAEQPVIALFAKTYDVTPDKACLIAIPKINDNGKKLAALYRIDIIEAKRPEETLKAVEALIT